MPILMVKLCTWPGCTTIVARGRCAKHPYEDRSGHNPKYARRPWRELRAAHLRAHPLCEDHMAMGQVVPSACVDHRDGDPDNDAPSNLRALCVPCHSRKTAHQDGGFGNTPGTPRPATGVDGWPVSLEKTKI